MLRHLGGFGRRMVAVIVLGLLVMGVAVGVARGAPAAANVDVNGIVFTNPGPQGTRDIRTEGNAGGLRIFNQDPTLTTNPTGAALQFFANNSNFPGQAFLDSGANNAAALIFRTAQTGQEIAERMRVTADGKVGIGTTTPSTPLEVRTGTGSFGIQHTDGNRAVSTYVGSSASGADGGWLGTVSNHSLHFFTANGQPQVTLHTNGNVGIGTSNPLGSKLDVEGSIEGAGITLTGGSVTGSDSLFLNAFGTNTGKIVLRTTIGGPQVIDRMTILNNGNVGIGNTIPGQKLTVSAPSSNTGAQVLRVEKGNGQTSLIAHDDGTVAIGALLNAQSATHVCIGTNFFQGCSSAAEYVPTVETGLGFPQMADLVSVERELSNPYGDDHGPFVVKKSATSCDPNLLGFLLDPELGADGKKVNEHYLPLAIYGYFPAKVTMEGGTIRRGDAITSSSTPGAGMKATGACRTIGYALEDADEDGTIQVFANTGDSSAGEVNALKDEVAALRQQNAALEERLAALEARLAR
jgi:hypothetical protein